MLDVIEIATSSRAKCGVCRKAIAKGEHRFVEKVLDPYEDDEYALLSYHLQCAAEKRPFKLSPILARHKAELPDRACLEATIKVACPRQLLERVLYANRAPTGRAKCQHCRTPIEKNALRLVVALDDPLHAGTAFVHATCARAYVGTERLAAHLKARSAKLSKADWTELRRLIG